MLTIEDIEIKIKKYDKDKNLVIVNVVVFGELEIRGFTVRYTTTKHSLYSPVWLVSPPSLPTRSRKYFWVVKFSNSALWQQLQERIIEQAREHANSV